jgi:hypothetical protein
MTPDLRGKLEELAERQLDCVAAIIGVLDAIDGDPDLEESDERETEEAPWMSGACRGLRAAKRIRRAER